MTLCGGCTSLPGFTSRFETEIRSLYFANVDGMPADIRIEESSSQSTLVLQGALVLAEIVGHKPECWVSKAEYEEQGYSRCAAMKKMF